MVRTKIDISKITQFLKKEHPFIVETSYHYRMVYGGACLFNKFAATLSNNTDKQFLEILEYGEDTELIKNNRSAMYLHDIYTTEESDIPYISIGKTYFKEVYDDMIDFVDKVFEKHTIQVYGSKKYFTSHTYIKLRQKYIRVIVGIVAHNFTLYENREVSWIIDPNKFLNVIYYNSSAELENYEYLLNRELKTLKNVDKSIIDFFKSEMHLSADEFYKQLYNYPYIRFAMIINPNAKKYLLLNSGNLKYIVNLLGKYVETNISFKNNLKPSVEFKQLDVMEI